MTSDVAEVTKERCVNRLRSLDPFIHKNMRPARLVVNVQQSPAPLPVVNLESRQHNIWQLDSDRVLISDCTNYEPRLVRATEFNGFAKPQSETPDGVGVWLYSLLAVLQTCRIDEFVQAATQLLASATTLPSDLDVRNEFGQLVSSRSKSVRAGRYSHRLTRRGYSDDDGSDPDSEGADRAENRHCKVLADVVPPAMVNREGYPLGYVENHHVELGTGLAVLFLSANRPIHQVDGGADRLNKSLAQLLDVHVLLPQQWDDVLEGFVRSAESSDAVVSHVAILGEIT